MKNTIKKHKIEFLLLVMIFVIILCWVSQGMSSQDSWKAISAIAFVVSAYITFLHFRLKTTLDKISAIILSPNATEYIVRVLRFIDEGKDGKRTELINKQTIESDKDLFASVLFLLGSGDDLSIAIMNGIVDETLARDSIGIFITRIYKGLRPYIEDVDELHGKSHYPNLMALNSRWM